MSEYIEIQTEISEVADTIRFRIATNRRALGDVAALAAVGAHQAPDEDFVS